MNIISYKVVVKSMCRLTRIKTRKKRECGCCNLLSNYFMSLLLKNRFIFTIGMEGRWFGTSQFVVLKYYHDCLRHYKIKFCV